MQNVLEAVRSNAKARQESRAKALAAYKHLLTNPDATAAEQLAEVQAVLGKSDDDVRADVETIHQADQLRQRIVTAKVAADREPAEESAALKAINDNCKREVLGMLDYIGIEAIDRLTLEIKQRCEVADNERQAHYKVSGQADAKLRDLQFKLNQLVREHPDLL
jgi:hypothetical protein